MEVTVERSGDAVEPMEERGEHFRDNLPRSEENLGAIEAHLELFEAHLQRSGVKVEKAGLLTCKARGPSRRLRRGERE